jgi:hypothetical protein
VIAGYIGYSEPASARIAPGSLPRAPRARGFASARVSGELGNLAPPAPAARSYASCDTPRARTRGKGTGRRPEREPRAHGLSPLLSPLSPPITGYFHRDQIQDMNI